MTTIKTITQYELAQKVKYGEDVQIVNVLEPESYHLGFIKGSKGIPVSELDQRQNELDKSKEVIVYCASYTCNASKKAAEKLLSLGFNVRAYEGGIKEWKESELPVEEETTVQAA